MWVLHFFSTGNLIKFSLNSVCKIDWYTAYFTIETKPIIEDPLITERHATRTIIKDTPYSLPQTTPTPSPNSTKKKVLYYRLGEEQQSNNTLTWSHPYTSHSLVSLHSYKSGEVPKGDTLVIDRELIHSAEGGKAPWVHLAWLMLCMTFYEALAWLYQLSFSASVDV